MSREDLRMYIKSPLLEIKQCALITKVPNYLEKLGAAPIFSFIYLFRIVLLPLLFIFDNACNSRIGSSHGFVLYPS